MTCRACGRRTTRTQNGGPSARVVLFYQVEGCLCAEILCFRCRAWGIPDSPVWGKLYARRA